MVYTTLLTATSPTAASATQTVTSQAERKWPLNVDTPSSKDSQDTGSDDPATTAAPGGPVIES